MLGKFKLLNKVSVLGVGAAVLLFGLLAFFFWPGTDREDLAFPGLQVGHYVGVVEKFPLAKGEGKATLYIERLPDVETMVLLVFAPGNSPVSLLATPAFPENITSGRSLDEVPLEAPVFSYNGSEYTFFGSLGDRDPFRGEVLRDGEAYSSWTMKFFELPSLDVRKELERDFGERHIEEWLALKADLADVIGQQEEGAQILSVQNSSIDRLQAYLSADGSERAKVLARVTNLSSSKDKEDVSLSKTQEGTEKAWRKLEVLNRITESGKTVRLLRRLARREDKWYDVNWRDTAGVDSQVAALIQADKRIDYRDYRVKLAKAQEIRSIQTQIRNEQKRIQQITRPPKRPLAEAVPASQGTIPPVPTESKPKKKRSLWDRLF